MDKVFVLESEKVVKHYGEIHALVHTCTIARHKHYVTISSGAEKEYIVPVTQTFIRYKNAMAAMNFMENAEKEKQKLSGLKSKPLSMYPRNANVITDSHQVITVSVYLN